LNCNNLWQFCRLRVKRSCKNKLIRLRVNYNQQGKNYSNKHKHCLKRDMLNLINKVITLLVITIFSACKSRSRQWEKAEEKQQTLSILLVERILGKKTTPRQLNTINNSSA
jgi:hypothetical protein